MVTGIGSVTPLGNSFARSWIALTAGKSGIAAITKFDASSCRWKAAGEVRDFDPAAYLDRKEVIRLDPFIHYAVAAALMAVEDAGLVKHSRSGKREECRFAAHPSLSSGGVIIGSSRGGVSSIEKALLKDARLSPYLMPSTTISMAASSVSQRLGMRGNCLGISNACASGANAVGEAFRLIRCGHADIVLAGGAEAPVCRLCIEGYGISGALSRVCDASASRPFDKGRDGFVLSEGACVLVIESCEHAERRGARIYGEVAGYGNTTDAFHMTKPDAEGEARTIARALEEAGAVPDEVDYINTHGTSTPLGDAAESSALSMVFGTRLSGIPASAVKSMTGHMLAASGSFEVASTLMTLREGVIPPTINLREQDPGCSVNVVREKRNAKIGFAISNSFGFGGVNAVIALRAP